MKNDIYYSRFFRYMSSDDFAKDDGIETWVYIADDYKGLYAVCDDGRCVSLHKEKPHIKKAGETEKGYLYYELAGKKVRANRLIAEAFHSDEFPKDQRHLMEAHHIDRDKKNNCAENIQPMYRADHRKLHNEERTDRNASTEPEDNNHQEAESGQK